MDAKNNFNILVPFRFKLKVEGIGKVDIFF